MQSGTPVRQVTAILAALISAVFVIAALPAVSVAATPTVVGTTVQARAKQRPACQRLSVRQRVALRRVLAGRALTPLRCRQYGPIMRAAAARARARARLVAVQRAKATQVKRAKAAQVKTVFGLSANGEDALRTAESKLGVTAGIVGVFADFTTAFPTADANSAAARGASLLISWEPWNWNIKSQIQPDYALDRITAGDHDSYIRQFARDAAATKRPVFVRFAAEMNGDWHVWSTGFNGNGTNDYRDAYRHVVNVARSAGGTNIKWMFNPIVSYVGSTPLSQLYPGDAYVDWVALDGYNWGPLKWGWQSFDTIFARGLAELKSVAANKPLGIAEIGSYPGEQQAAWVANALQRARAQGARMIVWFEHNKETDWRLSSTPQVAATTRSVVTQPGWVTGGNYSLVRGALGI